LNEIANTVPAIDMIRLVQISPQICPKKEGNIHGSATINRYPKRCPMADWKEILVNDFPSNKRPDGRVNIKLTIAGPAVINPIWNSDAPSRAAYTD
jgi:hypothetical protein